MKDNNKECLRCGYSWKAKVKNPVECPDCKRRSWKTKINGVDIEDFNFKEMKGGN